MTPPEPDRQPLEGPDRTVPEEPDRGAPEDPDRMTPEERRALAALRFEWAPSRQDIWAPVGVHTAEVNSHAAELLGHGFGETAASTEASPLGIALLGEKGSGKTHLVNWLRGRVLLAGGYYFPLRLWEGYEFWRSVVQSLVDGLYRPVLDGRSQLNLLLERLAERLALPPAVADEVCGRTDLTPVGLEQFINALGLLDRDLGRQCQHVARALAMFNARDFETQNLGEGLLLGADDADPAQRKAWRMPAVRPPQQVLAEISRLLAVTGPTVFTVDQIDTMIAQSNRASSTGLPDPVQGEQLERIAAGFMELRDSAYRSMTVVACMEAAWQVLLKTTVNSVGDRFRTVRLKALSTAPIGRKFAADWMGVQFASCGFTPPYETWPIRPDAFSDTIAMTPRALLKRIAEHAERCLELGRVEEIDRFEEPDLPVLPKPLQVDPAAVARLDERFAALCAESLIPLPLDPKQESELMPDCSWPPCTRPCWSRAAPTSSSNAATARRPRTTRCSRRRSTSRPTTSSTGTSGP